MSESHIRKVLRTQREVSKVERLVQHLGISLSLMADADVLAKLNRGGGSAPASTAERNREPALAVRYLSGRRGSTPRERTSGRTGFTTVFDASQMPPLDNLAGWLGVAWHELGHILWSVFAGQITVGLNLLEDARIETLLLQKHPRTRGALMAALCFLLDGMRAYGSSQSKPSDPVFMYAWVAGRTHLDRQIRTEFRALAEAKRPGVAQRIDDIFKDYLSMGSKYDQDKAKRLAAMLDKILGTADKLGSGSCSDTLTRVRGVPTQHELDHADIEPSTIEEIGGDPTPDDTPGSAGAGEAAGSVGEAATKLSTDTRNTVDKLRGALDSAAASDEALRKEIDQLERHIAKAYPEPRSSEIQVKPPTPDARRRSREIRRLAASFNDDSGKGLVRRLDHGRIKPARYERTGDIDSAYDAWEPGLSQEMYIILMIDISGSMRNAPVSEVLYALEVGLSDVATVEPVLWSDSYEIPPVSNSPTRMVDVQVTGGTNPVDGLAYSHHKLLNHPAANRLLVMYTDGEFNKTTRKMNGDLEYTDNYDIVRAYMLDLLAQGVQVQVLDEQGKGGCSRLNLPDGHVHKVKEIGQLPKVVQGWTRQVLTTR